jgi:hypothetical protein
MRCHDPAKILASHTNKTPFSSGKEWNFDPHIIEDVCMQSVTMKNVAVLTPIDVEGRGHLESGCLYFSLPRTVRCRWGRN